MSTDYRLPRNMQKYDDGYLEGMIDREAGETRRVPLAECSHDWAAGYHDGRQNLPERSATKKWKI